MKKIVNMKSGILKTDTLFNKSKFLLFQLKKKNVFITLNYTIKYLI